MILMSVETGEEKATFKYIIIDRSEGGGLFDGREVNVKQLDVETVEWLDASTRNVDDD